MSICTKKRIFVRRSARRSGCGCKRPTSQPSACVSDPRAPSDVHLAEVVLALGLAEQVLNLPIHF